MTRWLHASLIAGLFIAVGSSSAQTVEGLDLAKARARAKAQTTRDLEAFSRDIERRAEGLKGAAEQTRAGAVANRARVKAGSVPGRPGAGVDLDEMLAGSEELARAGQGTKPRFIAFASLSMPPAALKQMMRDVSGAGGVVVFRGFPRNSVKLFMAGLSKALEPRQQLNGVGIDPRLFRAFDVTAVPTYVVVSSDFEPCDGFDCTTRVPPHDRIGGNITPAYALRTVAVGGGPGAAVAKVYLRALVAKGRGQ
jgi:conjugal transfer pilus assembly protein TrbC